MDAKLELSETIIKSNMSKTDFNKIFNIFITAGMTVVMVIMTAIKLRNSDTDAAMLIVAAFGSLMGVLATVCSANAKILTFLFGLFDVSIYGIMCYMSGAYGNAALHMLYFVPMQFIGFYQWRKRGTKSGAHSNIRARRLTGRQWLVYTALFVVGLAASYLILNRVGEESTAVASFFKMAILTDAFAMMCNIFGQFLMSTAYMEQWVFWIGVNISTIILWSVKMTKGEASDYGIIYVIKYAFYLLNSLNGLRIWLALSRPNKVEN